MQSLWVEAVGLRLHALAATGAGGATAEPLVLVHGLGVSSRYMRRALIELAPDFDVYAPDLPGCGRSERPARAPNVKESADALAAWMQAAGVERAALVGHSLGCQVVAELAARRPVLVTRVVLAAPTGDPRRSAVGQFFRLLLNAPREPLSLIPLVVGDYLRAGIVRGALTFAASLRHRVEERLPRVSAPALVVHGSRDPIVSRRWVEDVARLLPRGRLVVIEGAAHALNYNSAAQFARVVREFVRG